MKKMCVCMYLIYVYKCHCVLNLVTAVIKVGLYRKDGNYVTRSLMLIFMSNFHSIYDSVIICMLKSSLTILLLEYLILKLISDLSFCLLHD